MRVIKVPLFAGFLLIILLCLISMSPNVSADDALDDSPPTGATSLDDIEIEKEVLSTGPYRIGSEVEYRVTLTNNAVDKSDALFLIDEENPYTGRLLFKNCHSNISSLQCDVSNRQLHWSGEIPGNFPAIITYKADIVAGNGQANSNDIINVATVRWLADGQGGEFDSASQTITVEEANSPILDDITIKKEVLSGAGGPYHVGDAVGYKVILTNTNTENNSVGIGLLDEETSATGRLTFKLCTATIPSDKCTNLTDGAEQLEWSGVIPKGETAEITYVAVIGEGNNPANYDDPIVNTATISSQAGGDPKPSSQAITVEAINTPTLDDITIAKEVLSEAGTGPYHVGEEVQYKVTLINTNADNPSVEIDLLDEETSATGRLSFKSCAATIPSDKCIPELPNDTQQLKWSGMIPKGEMVEITYVAVIGDGNNPTNYDDPVENTAKISSEAGGEPKPSSQTITVETAGDSTFEVFMPIIINRPLFPKIVNGGFEIQPPGSGWTEDSIPSPPPFSFIVHKDDSALGSVQPHNGDWLAWLGGINHTTEYTLTQTITANYKDTYLLFYERVGSRDQDCTGNPDKAFVYVNSEPVDERVLCQPQNSDWDQNNLISLDQFVNGNTSLQFDFVVRLNSQNGLGTNSNWFLDDVSICSKGNPLPDGATQCP